MVLALFLSNSVPSVGFPSNVVLFSLSSLLVASLGSITLFDNLSLFSVSFDSL